MFRKIITYFLILAVVLPVFAAAVPFGGKINRAQAEGATTENSNNASFSSPCDFNPVVAVAQTASNAFYKITRTEWIKKGLDWVENEVVSYVKEDPSSGHTGGSVWSCASYTITYLLYEFVMKIAIWFVGLASNLFNISIQFALTGESFDADKNTMIKDGWTMVRDLLNLVFIFILLFAAISTILQYGGFEIKKVLPSLIVAALLVNFSMMIAKMVIDASHIFAWEFYNQIDVTKEGTLPDMQGSIEVNKEFEKKNLASVFMAGFNPQQLLTGKGETANTTTLQSPWKEVYKKAIDKGESVDSTLWRMIIIILLEITLSIFSAFILLAGAIMFVARVVVLWLVMIFSPLAFLSMILPSMGKYSQMWWSYLINQSFLAPAFLFMFMLATKFINSKFIDTILKINENDDSAIVTGLSMGEIALIFFNFLIVGGILMACLIVARQLGGKTAEFGIKWAHKGKDLALGGALKYVPKPLLRHTVGSVSSGMAKSEWAERMAARSPVIGGWMKGVLKKGGDVGGFDKIMEQRIKTGQGLSTPELRAQYLSNLSAREQAEWYKGSSARTRVELEDAALKGGHVTALNNMVDVHKKLSLEEQEKTIKARAEVDIKKSDAELADVFFIRSEEIQKEILNQMKAERKPEFINKLHSGHGAILTSAARTPLTGTGGAGQPPAQYTSAGRAARKFRPDLLSPADIDMEVGKHKPDDVKNLDPIIATNSNVIDAMIKQYNGGHVQKLIEKGDALTEEFIKKLTSGSGGNAQAVSYRLRHNPNIQNHALANWIDTNKTARDMLGLS